MSELLRFFNDMRDNGYGLAEIAAQLGTSAIAEPVAGFAAMYDPAHGADAIREGMTYQPRSQEAQEYSQSIGNAAKTAIKPAMPIIDTWKKGVDIAGQYSPVVGAALRTVPTAIGIAMGAKPALQAGRQVSNTLGSLQGRMVANANAPRTLNTGYMGQRGAIGTLSTDDDLRALAKFNQMDDVYKFDNSHEYYDPIDKLVARNLSDDAFDFMELPTSYGKMSITPSAKEQGKWQVTQWSKDGNPLSDSGNLTKEKALRIFFEDSRPELLAAPKRPLTEFEQAHQLAQRNAALPVEKGGLGLAPDNTAMDRARAMGFDVDNPVYHGTNWDIEAFDPKLSLDVKGVHVGQQHQANHFSSRVGGVNYPLLIKKQRIMEDMPDSFLNPDRLYEDFARDVQYNDLTRNSYHGDLLSKAKEADKASGFKTRDDGVIPKEKAYFRELNRILKENNIDSISYENEKEFLRGNDNTSYLIPDVRRVRSINAAFDPKKSKSSNLLAQSAKLAPTTALGAYMYNEKRKKSQGNQ